MKCSFSQNLEDGLRQSQVQNLAERLSNLENFSKFWEKNKEGAKPYVEGDRLMNCMI